MKYFLLSLFIFSFSYTFSQNGLKFNNTSGVEDFGQSSFFKPIEDDFEGSIHLFKNWDNNAIVHTIDEVIFKLDNINLNIKSNAFQTKTSKDSLFTFNLKNIRKIVINNKVYKSIYLNQKNKICQIIYESNNVSLIKGYELEVLEKSSDPMANRPKSKYVLKESYFIKDSNGFRPITLKKKSILALFNDKSDLVGKYVKENKLSYKREKDLNKMFIYYDSL